MRRFLGFVFEGILLLSVIQGNVIAKTASACYGTEPGCAYYTMLCNDTEVIRLGDLYAGWKNDTAACGSINRCNDTELCCQYANGDHTEVLIPARTYETYRNCSGKQECSEVQAPWQTSLTDTSRRGPSGYVTLDYTCEPRSSKLQFCKDISSVTNATDILFNGDEDLQNGTNTGKDCKCDIVNSDANEDVTLVISYIDVRLPRLSSLVNETENCSNAVLTFKDNTISCTPSTMHYQDNFFYSENNNVTLTVTAQETLEIKLANLFQDGLDDAPKMVWLQIKADRYFNVSCGEVTYSSTSTTMPVLVTNLTDSTSVSTTTSDPITSSTDSTSPSTTTSDLVTSSTDSTSVPATTSDPVTTSAYTTTTHAGTEIPRGDKDSLKTDDSESDMWYVYTFVPIGVILALLVIVCITVRRRMKKPFKLRLMKNASEKEVYNRLRNTEILDDFINMHSLRESDCVDSKDPQAENTTNATDIRQVAAVYSVDTDQTAASTGHLSTEAIPGASNGNATLVNGTSPNHITRNIDTEYSLKQNPTSQGRPRDRVFLSVYEPGVTEEMEQTKIRSTPGRRTISGVETTNNITSIISQSNGEILISVNNICNDSVPWKRTLSTVGFANHHAQTNEGSAQNVSSDNDATRRTSTGPAVISVGTINERRSDQVHMFPGHGKVDNSVLFIKT